MEDFMMFYNIFLNHCKEMWIHSGTNGCGFYCYIEEREVVVPPEAFKHPDKWDIFSLLHEIGHIKTNTVKQKRYYQEYLATQWAIQEAKKIGFKVPKKYIKTYQDYILRWRETSIKHKGKNIHTKEELKLVV